MNNNAEDDKRDIKDISRKRWKPLMQRDLGTSYATGATVWERDRKRQKCKWRNSVYSVDMTYMRG